MIFVALLRAVNVGGRSVPMAQLRVGAEKLGFANVSTVLQSGNLVFETSKQSDVIERELEADIARRFRLQAAVIVRTAAQLAEVVRRNPFTTEATRDPGRLVAVFLKRKLAAKAEADLRAAIVGRERVTLGNNVLYAYYPDGQGRSKLTVALIDRKLATTGTARNWNTVLKLKAAAEARR